jgi:hypothetical protein
MDDPHLVTYDEPDLDDRERREHEQRKDEGKLDRSLTRVATPPATPPQGDLGSPRVSHPGSTLSMTLSNSFEIAWLPVAHVISNVATATAPRMTSAYSAVVCPDAFATVNRADSQAVKRRNMETSSGLNEGVIRLRAARR